MVGSDIIPLPPPDLSQEEGIASEPMNAKANGEKHAMPSDGGSSRKMKPLSWFLIVFSLLAALFLFALDNTIVADVQARVIYTLGGIEKLPWISVAFALGAVSTNLVW